MVGRLYSILVVCVGFVLFRADTVGQGFLMIRQMFTGFAAGPQAVSLLWQQMTPWFLFTFVIAVIGAGPIRPLADRLRARKEGEAPLLPAARGGLYVLSFLLLIWCVVRLSGGGYNPFIYFRF